MEFNISKIIFFECPNVFGIKKLVESSLRTFLYTARNVSIAEFYKISSSCCKVFKPPPAAKRHRCNQNLLQSLVGLTRMDARFDPIRDDSKCTALRSLKASSLMKARR